MNQIVELAILMHIAQRVFLVYDYIYSKYDLINVTIRFNSSSVKFEPLGKQSPVLYKVSDTPFK